MAAWPGTLPTNLNVEGFSETSEPGIVRTSMDAGPAFQRVRYSAVPKPITGTLVLSASLVGTLDTFFHTTLNEGADEFDWYHPRTGVSVSMRFTSPPQYVPHSDDLWTVSLSLEIMP